ncbi:MAG: hypothetical protein RIK87_21315 [Fuerstiella sp.]
MIQPFRSHRGGAAAMEELRDRLLRSRNDGLLRQPAGFEHTIGSEANPHRTIYSADDGHWPAVAQASCLRINNTTLRLVAAPSSNSKNRTIYLLRLEAPATGGLGVATDAGHWLAVAQASCLRIKNQQSDTATRSWGLQPQQKKPTTYLLRLEAPATGGLSVATPAVGRPWRKHPACESGINNATLPRLGPMTAAAWL